MDSKFLQKQTKETKQKECGSGLRRRLLPTSPRIRINIHVLVGVAFIEMLKNDSALLLV